MRIGGKGKEKSRQQSEDRFRLLFDSAADALFLHDLEGRFVEVNQAACDSLGYTREELLQLPLPTIVKDWDPKALDDLWARVIQGEKLTVQGLHRRQNGTTFPAEVRLSPFEYAGRPHILAAARDITKRLQAEDAQRTSESFLNSIIDQSPYPMWISDDRGTLLRLNQTCQDLLHLTAAEVVGKYNVFQDNIVEEQGFFPLLQRVFEGGETVRFELTYDTSLLKILPVKTPTLVILDVTVSPVKDGSGKITNAVFQHVDITHRKRAEAALAESEQRFSIFMDHLPAVSFIKDQAGRLLFANRYLQETFGWEDCLGKTTEELLPPDLAAQMAADDRRALTEGPIVVQEGIVDTHGVERFFDTYKFPVKGEGASLLEGGIAVDVTERKRAEEALKKEKLFTEAILDSLPGVFFLFDSQGKHLRTNTPGQVLSGYSFEELPNMHALDFIAEEDKPAVQRALAEVFEKGETSVEAQQLTKDGRKIPFFFTAKKFIIDNMPCLLGTGLDITQIKQTEEALRESQEYRKTVMESVGAGIMVVDAETRQIVDINPFAEKIIGMPREEIIGKICHEHICPAEIGKCPVMDLGLTIDQSERSLLTGCGQTIPILKTVTHFQKEGRKYLLESFLDITERKQAEEALRESEKRLREAQEMAHLGFWYWNVKTGDVTWSDEVYNIFQLDPEEFTPHIDSILELSPWPEDHERDKELIRKAMESHEKGAFEQRFLLPDKSIGYYYSTFQGKYDDGGNLISIVGTVLDITARKRAEEERARLEAQMREVQKLESLGVLAGGIAHDFNNLLMAILGNADLALLSLSPASPARPNVEEIVRASQRAADLCRQMLAYSGKGRFVVGRYDLTEIVREMTQILKVSVSKKAALRYSFAADLPAVEVDATQMRQVIMNLITNASEALGDASGIISVSTGVMDCDRAYLAESHLDDKLPEGRYVYLEVADTGCGMNEETRRRLFDPFFTTKFTGRGLGLAAVLGIVRGHQGAIKVHSEPGKGTTFTILLPAVAWQPDDQVLIATLAAAPHRQGTILLIDDDPHVRRVAGEMLARLGLQVLTAAHSQEGLEIFQTKGKEIDCVLLDLTMPGMGGEEAFQEMRRLRPDVRVVLSSGYDEQDATQQFAGQGLAGFIQKPYTVAKLQEVLNRVLG